MKHYCEHASPNLTALSLAVPGRMNLSLRDVVCTSRDGDKFWKIPECYIRGNNIKYLRVPDEVIDKVVEEPKSKYHQLPFP